MISQLRDSSFSIHRNDRSRASVTISALAQTGVVHQPGARLKGGVSAVRCGLVSQRADLGHVLGLAEASVPDPGGAGSGGRWL
mmetsp:Transcript_8383/g.20783  ORF Transcript_8383/g.20783 Transcript_8383/m.20783 type:complete len:83 (-) Transcript_8383:47-295(-)